MTLHETIVSEAPEGVAVRDCPGAFIAITARRPDGITRVFYVGRNDSPIVERWTLERAAAFVAGDM